MDIIPLTSDHLSQASCLFAEDVTALKRIIPELSTTLADPPAVLQKLEHLLDVSGGVAAVDGGELLGYLGWFVIEDFRGSGRRAAYCPEWGHAAVKGHRLDICRQLYRAASREWFGKSCNMFAVTFLSHETEQQNFWFWNGFGLTVIDAIRPAVPLGEGPLSCLDLHRAGMPDLDALYDLELEHVNHYKEPPVLMYTAPARTKDEWKELLTSDKDSAWIAYDRTGSTPADAASYMVFEDGSRAVNVVHSPATVSITAAYTRPQFRGLRAAACLLDAGLKEYASRGYATCSVDFESINMEASVFWTRYFRPVCYSAFRVPERQPGAAS